METAILLLAAGSSSRMGQSKQLLDIAGSPLLVHAARQALGACPQVIVVLGSQADAHRNALAGLPVTIIENNEWQRGMGRSLKCGLSHLRALTPSPEMVLIMLCDQPCVSTAHLAKLIRRGKESEKSIIASTYGATTGVPALFKANLFDQLASIGDEAGAAKLIRTHADQVEAIYFPGGDTDLDTLKDYTDFLATNPKQ